MLAASTVCSAQAQPPGVTSNPIAGPVDQQQRQVCHAAAIVCTLFCTHQPLLQGCLLADKRLYSQIYYKLLDVASYCCTMKQRAGKACDSAAVAAAAA
jgi:hypothetical protein